MRNSAALTYYHFVDTVKDSFYHLKHPGKTKKEIIMRNEEAKVFKTNLKDLKKQRKKQHQEVKNNYEK